jgi:hypothetical protein
VDGLEYTFMNQYDRSMAKRGLDHARQG